VLTEVAAKAPSPPDRCYVFNFTAPHRPNALELPAGRGRGLAQAMQALIRDLRAAIPAAFESDAYRARAQEIEAELTERQSEAIAEIANKAGQQGIALLRTPAGFGFAPKNGDGVLAPEQFAALPEAERQRLEAAIGALQEELAAALRKLPKWHSVAQQAMRDLNRDVVRSSVAGLIDGVQHEFRDLPEVLAYLEQVEEDLLDHGELFRPSRPGEGGPPAELVQAALRRYEVNVLVANAPERGAPVVHEDHPTHGNLLGRIEHQAQMGALLTDFSLLRAGALHRANGGYLVIDALRLLQQPFAWEALKRALRSGELRMEAPGQAYGLVSTVSLEPEPIPLALKVVLVGERQLYYALAGWDAEFRALFTVLCDFDDELVRDTSSERALAAVVAAMQREQGLRPFDRAAVERVVEAQARSAGERDRLSANLRALAELLREADYWAGVAAADVVQLGHVTRALDARIERADRLHQRRRDDITRGGLLIATGGARVGQVNALSVWQLGDFAFGSPSRVTARVRSGSGRVLDIERETELGGPIHSKGVMILSGFLAGRYLPTRPLALSASLVFEQSYGGVEGDSASSAELYALLSALAGVGLKQSLAVTGSVNQHGDIQAVGGINEKIEGFFDVCRARGLDGTQGVLIPAANTKQLMLRAEVVEAAAAGQFHIYPVETVDQGIACLTGLPAGSRGGDGRYPPSTVNARVEASLARFAEVAAATKGRELRR
jgi:lon-related putative ATP-dependent protease